MTTFSLTVCRTFYNIVHFSERLMFSLLLRVRHSDSAVLSAESPKADTETFFCQVPNSKLYLLLSSFICTTML